MIVKFKNLSYNISSLEMEEVKDNQKVLGISYNEAIEMLLCDKGLLTNEEQQELVKKPQVSFSGEKEITERKTYERERKVNGAKAILLDNIIEGLNAIEEVSDMETLKSEKLITFKFQGKMYKVDLIQTRQKKKGK